MNQESPLFFHRIHYKPQLPKALEDIPLLHAIAANNGFDRGAVSLDVQKQFPATKDNQLLQFTKAGSRSAKALRVGIVLSGGQAAGGHNVIAGVFDGLKRLDSSSRLFGFLNGPKGVIDNKFIEITEDKLAPYRNMGGFDLIGSGRTKIETNEQYLVVDKNLSDLQLDGLVIVGGDDSNTNAALLAEYLLKQNRKISVIGVPKTIDGDLKNEFIEISFGFDTATKTYSEFIGNVARDAISAKKYYFFIKVMGRSASHVALECALQTHPNKTFIGEEVCEKKQTVAEITHELCEMICNRSANGKDYGVVLIPEGLIEFIPECRVLIQEINRLMGADPFLARALAEASSSEERSKILLPKLSEASRSCFIAIPESIQAQLLLDRDPHGNVQVSKIETERFFIETVKRELLKRADKGEYKGQFNAQPLFCGYEGRSCYPTNFDANYCYNLGLVASLLVADGYTGYMAILSNLAEPVEKWQPAGVPLVRMIHFEERSGKQKPVIQKALVDLNGAPFMQFAKQRAGWELNDEYRYPGPVQFFGPDELADGITLTLLAESNLANRVNC